MKTNLQTYKSYKTYKPINIEQGASQPGGPEGAGGSIAQKIQPEIYEESAQNLVINW